MVVSGKGEHDKKMNIAMISLHSCPMSKLGGQDTGGMNVYIRELAAELGRRGHRVDIFTRSHRPEHEQSSTLCRNTRLVHLKIGMNEEIPKIACYPYIGRFTRKIQEYAAETDTRYDVIHSHYWLSGLIGKQLKSAWHIPHITMFHTLAALKNRSGVGSQEPGLRLAGEREIIEDCDRIIAGTAAEKAGLIEHYCANGDTISVIPCGVNLNLFRRVDGSRIRSSLGVNGHKLLLYVGRIEPVKGLECLLRALSYFDEEESPRLMVIGGDAQNHSQMLLFQDLASSCNTLDRVHFIGSLEHEKLPDYYSAADACIIPSYYESFGIVALESLACGTPVIATDVGTMRDIILTPRAGTVVRNNDPHTLMREIGAFLSSGHTAAEAAMRRQAVEGYSWEIVTDRIVQLYNDSQPAPQT